MKGNEIQCNEIKYAEMKNNEMSIRFGREMGLPEADKRFGRQICPRTRKYTNPYVILTRFQKSIQIPM